MNHGDTKTQRNTGNCLLCQNKPRRHKDTAGHKELFRYNKLLMKTITESPCFFVPPCLCGSKETLWFKRNHRDTKTQSNTG